MSKLYEFHLSYTFAGEALEELNRKISFLLSTPVGTMPLDREFGVDMSFLDMPSEASKSLYVVEITEKIAKFIPEARVESVSWVASPAGTLIPKVVITNGSD